MRGAKYSAALLAAAPGQIKRDAMKRRCTAQARRYLDEKIKTVSARQAKPFEAF
jgi:hypothetical protein